MFWGVLAVVSAGTHARAQTPEHDLAESIDPREAHLDPDPSGDASMAAGAGAGDEAEGLGAALGAQVAHDREGHDREGHDREGEGAAENEGEGEEAESEEQDPVDWFLIPLAGYNSDFGFAGALLGQLYHHADGVQPFRDRVQLISTITSRFVQFHELIWERAGLFGQPLRMTLRGLFTGTPVGNYCGVGNEVTCSRDDAIAAANEQGLFDGDDGYRRFVRNYYRYRLFRPGVGLRFRWQPWRGREGFSRDVEFTGEWEGVYTLPGYVGGVREPFPGSLYDQDFADGEQGFQSEFRLGAVIDRRVNDLRPTGGYLFSAHLRGAHRYLGSDWNYAGLNLTAAGYFPLSRNRRLLFASRFVADFIVGDAPTTALASVVGFWNHTAFGGQEFGRGIRVRRYIGRIKIVAQGELRWILWGEEGDIRGVLFAFGDAGYVGVDYDDFGGNPRRILGSFGAGAGVYWGDAFLIRFDMGLSPYEHWEPQFYLNLRHPF